MSPREKTEANLLSSKNHSTKAAGQDYNLEIHPLGSYNIQQSHTFNEYKRFNISNHIYIRVLAYKQKYTLYHSLQCS